jgi:predicted enzyme related to lactoylglutathione lyase
VHHRREHDLRTFEYTQDRFVGEKETGVGQPVVHFEAIGKDGVRLQRYYAELFGWEIDADNPLNHGSVTREGNTKSEGIGMGGGIASPFGH